MSGTQVTPEQVTPELNGQAPGAAAQAPPQAPPRAPAAPPLPPAAPAAPAAPPTLELGGVKLDPNRLKLRELVDIEARIGRKVAEDMMTGLVGGDFMQGLLWIALRRRDSSVTYEAAGEYDFEQVNNLLADAADGDALAAGDAVDPPRPPSGGVSSGASPAPASSTGSPSSAISTG